MYGFACFDDACAIVFFFEVGDEVGSADSADFSIGEGWFESSAYFKSVLPFFECYEQEEAVVFSFLAQYAFCEFPCVAGDVFVVERVDCHDGVLSLSGIVEFCEDGSEFLFFCCSQQVCVVMDEVGDLERACCYAQQQEHKAKCLHTRPYAALLFYVLCMFEWVYGFIARMRGGGSWGIQR